MAYDLLIHDNFEQLQAGIPDVVAVVYGDQKITYAELEHKTNMLAAKINDVAPDDAIIAISTTRGIEMVVGLLGILKSGKAYLAIDKSAPAQLNKLIIADSGVQAYVGIATEQSSFAELGLNFIDVHSEFELAESNAEGVLPSLAYASYAINSDGRPEGLCMAHTALLNLLEWLRKTSIVGVGVTTLQLASLSSEVCFLEIFSTITTGGTLIIADTELSVDPDKLLWFIGTKAISRLFLPYDVLQKMADAAVSSQFFPATVAEVYMVGGQLKITSNISRFFEKLAYAVLYNLYAPVGCQVVSSGRLSGNPDKWSDVPSVGRPIDHVQLYILDEFMQQMPAGTEGDIWISGKCLAVGYLNNKQLTTTKFITWQHPAIEDLQIYIFKTNDRGLILPDGTLALANVAIDGTGAGTEALIADEDALTSKGDAASPESEPRDYIKEVIEKLGNGTAIDMKTLPLDIDLVQAGMDPFSLSQIGINMRNEYSMSLSFRQLKEQYNTIARLAGLLESVGGAVAPDPVQPQVPTEPTIATAPVEAAQEVVVHPDNVTNAAVEMRRHFIEDAIARYVKKTIASRTYSDTHTAHMAGSRFRSVSGSMNTDVMYPIVIYRSKGCRVWDVDGNEYVDTFNGFGTNLLGYNNEVIAKALQRQLDRGTEIIPLHEQTGEVCQLVSELSGFDKVAVCDSVTNAINGAADLARTINGRPLVITFVGSGHDASLSHNTLILDYGSDASLKVIKERKGEIAAILVEPVQHRQLGNVDIEFLKKLRALTESSDMLLIFDETVTGFRVGQGGAQAVLGIKADICIYGGVVAGGMAIGVIAGRAEVMDKLESTDHTTFIQQPFAIAAAKAVLEHIKRKEGELQKELTEKTTRMVDDLNVICRKYNVPLSVSGFGSMWKIVSESDQQNSELLFMLMREKGVYILNGTTCFLNAEHTYQDTHRITYVFDKSIKEMVTAHVFDVNVAP